MSKSSWTSENAADIVARRASAREAAAAELDARLQPTAKSNPAAKRAKQSHEAACLNIIHRDDVNTSSRVAQNIYLSKIQSTEQT